MDMNSDTDTPKRLQKDLFYKQQQQKLQNISIKKDLSADDLIRNILEKVDSDAKISKIAVPQLRNTQTVPNSSISREYGTNADSLQSKNVALPVPQCFLMCHEPPALYVRIWNAVKQNDVSEFCDRDKLYQVLLHTRLDSNVLAQLWSFVNRTVPGQLTRAELFIMLALIGLVQNKHFDPVNELYKITFIPLPEFAQLFQSETNPFSCGDFVKENSANTSNMSNVNTTPMIISHTMSNPVILPTKATAKSTCNDDDFADFKSADIDDCGINLDDQKPLNSSIISMATKLDSPPFFFNESANLVDNFDKANRNFSQTSSESHFDGPKVDPLPHSISNPSIMESPNIDNIQTSQQTDRYSSLRRLNLNNSAEEFGDFYSHSTIEINCDKDLPSYDAKLSDPAGWEAESATIVSQGEANQYSANPPSDPQVANISNKRKLLSACKQVMQKTFNVLIVSHGEESVVEALFSKDGANFARDLNEVFAIASRINLNLNVLNNSDEVALCGALFKEISRKYDLIYNLFRKSSINIDIISENAENFSNVLTPDLSKQDEPPKKQCSICSGACHIPGTSLSFAGFRYHISCANFWLNSVDTSLPNRHYEE